jgi:histidinol-phosphate aminotransferase
MQSLLEKGGATFEGLQLLLCENPLPPIDEAIAAAQAEAPRGNYYTEPYSAPLRRLLAEQLNVPEPLVHINAGSELILRQLFDRLGDRVHLLTPTYALFPEIARRVTETPLLPERGFAFDLAKLEVPHDTTLVVIVNPDNPSGGSFDMGPLPDLLRRHPATAFLVDGAFIDLGGRSVATLVERHGNLLVTRTLSKAHSLAGFRVGYAVLPSAPAPLPLKRTSSLPTSRLVMPRGWPSVSASSGSWSSRWATAGWVRASCGSPRRGRRTMPASSTRSAPSSEHYTVPSSWPSA